VAPAARFLLTDNRAMVRRKGASGRAIGLRFLDISQ